MSHYSDLKKHLSDENYSIFQVKYNLIRSQPKSTLKLRSALHFRYSIVIQAGLGTPSLHVFFR